MVYSPRRPPKMCFTGSQNFCCCGVANQCAWVLIGQVGIWIHRCCAYQWQQPSCPPPPGVSLFKSPLAPDAQFIALKLNCRKNKEGKFCSIAHPHFVVCPWLLFCFNSANNTPCKKSLVNFCTAEITPHKLQKSC